ncbi:gliding motility-associated C-terminal domain-containing protein [Flavobacterium sp. XGLA_31]|uniref:T9SS type B sorting domain-containing protein n=1 Tax=Flavobacterium sp. XGLA_31 TaxID=3447666 RepID=UPI003F374E3D
MSKKLCQQLQLLFLFLLFSKMSYGQLSNFTLTVNHTDETCTANGTLSFSASNTTAGASITYAIYRLPNTETPIAVVGTNSYTGLISGDYLIIATQTLGSESGIQQQWVTISDLTVDLTYQVSSTYEICGNDASITITPVSGTVLSYEITAGPIIRPPQTSNVFSNLTAGQYTIRVIDNCGEGVVQTYTVVSKNPALVFIGVPPGLAGCNSVTMGFTFSTLAPAPNGIVKYPLQVVLTITPPSGSPVVIPTTISAGNNFSATNTLFTPQPYNYSFVITDGCGVSYTVSGVVNNISNSVTSTLINVSCTTKKIKFAPITSLILTSAPAGYPNPLPQNFTSQITENQFTTQPLGVGTYVFQTVNVCGQSETLTIIIQAATPNEPYSFAYGVSCSSGSLAFLNVSQIVLVTAPTGYTGVLPYDFTSTINSAGTAVLTNIPSGSYTCNVLDSCGNPRTLTGVIATTVTAPGYTVLPDCANTNTLNINGELNAITLTNAPATYSGTVPQVLTSEVIANNLNLAGLPTGTYTFTTTNSCGITNPLNVIVPVVTETSTVNAIQNCGSFNLDLHHTSSSTAETTFWLQKYYAASNDWGHPENGALQGSNIPSAMNAIALTNNTLNLNLSYAGQFRVVKVQPVYVPGILGTSYCFKVINEFQTNGQPQILGVESVACNGTFDVLVDATGFGPLTYKITTKNGAPFVINNGTSNLFTNLTAAVYTFQVIDFCGNIVNSVLEVNVQNPLVILATDFCLNQSGSLSVPNFSFLTYQWWNTNNPSVILSTSNVLNFPNFNPTVGAGTYTVRITYAGNSASCLNTQLSYTISPDGFNPEAGAGNAVAYCEGKPGLNLFTLLSGAYDTDGTWTVISNNTTINGSDWNSATAATGVYQFRYKVTGNCNLTDEAIVTVTIKEIPEAPIVGTLPLICSGQDINLAVTPVPGVSYQWTGPNNFSATGQNPTIANASPTDNGTYTVKATKSNCVSESGSVEVVVQPQPQFVLEAQCSGGRYIVTAVPVDDSFDVDLVTYSWSGPDNYAAHVNPIDITQLPTGNYTLTVTDTGGCDRTNSIPISYTFCEVPNVITPNGDGANDSFNLSGLEVERLEIYSRWGRKVYEKDGYTNEWHGQNNHGDALPDSTYYYYIKLKSQETKVGWVFIAKG